MTIDDANVVGMRGESTRMQTAATAEQVAGQPPVVKTGVADLANTLQAFILDNLSPSGFSPAIAAGVAAVVGGLPNGHLSVHVTNSASAIYVELEVQEDDSLLVTDIHLVNEGASLSYA